MRVAVVGCGSIGRRHLRNLLTLGHEAVGYDIDPTVTEHPDWPQGVVFRAIGAVYSTAVSRIDACIIATPGSSRFYGTDVPTLVEKPLTRSVACYGPAMVGYHLRFHPKIVALKRAVETGQTGQPLHGRFYTLSDRSTWGGKSYGDTLGECSHEIDLALHTLGPARCVQAAAIKDGRLWDLMLAHECGAISHLTLSDANPAYERGGHVLGEHEAWSYQLEPGPIMDEAYLAELDHFLACVSAGAMTPPACTIAEGLAVLDIIDQARALSTVAA